MTDLAESRSECSGHSGLGEQRGPPPAAKHCLISVLVNVQNAVTFLNPCMCFLLFLCWSAGWDAGPLKPSDWKLGHAASQQTPVKGEERSQGRGGRELLLLQQSQQKKVRSRHWILHCVCLGACTACVCEERSRWLLSGDGLRKGKLQKVVSERDLKKKGRKPFLLKIQ